MYASAMISRLVLDAGKKLFTYPGGTIAPVYHECMRTGVDVICAKSEQGAGYMAIADALLTKSPAFIAVTSGPGVTNIVTCVADAFYDSIPLVIITGQVGTADLARPNCLRQRGFQEVPTSEMLKFITKKNYQPKNVDELKYALTTGYHIAGNGRPGPVVIDLPMDVQLTEIAEEIVEEFAAELLKESEEEKNFIRTKDTNSISEAVSCFTNTNSPVILVGGGALSDYETVKELADKLPVPVVSSFRGIGVLPSWHPRYFGWIGHTGYPWANEILFKADCVLVLGSRLDVRQTGSEIREFQKKSIIHVDIDRDELDFGRFKPTVRIHAPVGEFLKNFSPLLDGVSVNLWGKWENESRKIMELGSLQDFGTTQGVRPDELLRYINKISNDYETAIVTGVGAHQQWAGRYFSFGTPRKIFFSSAGHGTMGYGLPVSLGVKLFEPNRRVICIDGDGSFQMNMQELAVMKERELSVKILIMDNSRLGIVSQFQQITFGDDPVTGDFKGPDFSAVAKGYGIRSWTMTSFRRNIVDQWFDYDGPGLLHVKIQHDAPVSPMLLAGQSLNDMWRNKKEDGEV